MEVRPPAGPSGPVARAAAWYRRLDRASRTSVVALVAANAIPIVGVLFLGWSLMTILVLYWIENGIVGLWNLPKIALARGTGLADGPTRAAPPLGPAAEPLGCQKVMLLPFFAVHYGIFWLGHGFFLSFLPTIAAFGSRFGPGPADPFGPGTELGGPGLWVGDVAEVNGVELGGLLLPIAALVVSHGVSFFVNYLGRRENLAVSPERQMVTVYGRVVALHLTILLGGFAALALGGPIWILVVLVIAKTVLDVGFHAREHRLAEPP